MVAMVFYSRTTDFVLAVWGGPGARDTTPAARHARRKNMKAPNRFMAGAFLHRFLWHEERMRCGAKADGIVLGGRLIYEIVVLGGRVFVSHSGRGGSDDGMAGKAAQVVPPVRRAP